MKLMIILLCVEKAGEIAEHGSLFSGTTEIASCRVGISSMCLGFLLELEACLRKAYAMSKN